MHTALIAVLSGRATGFLVVLALFLERWEWEYGIRFYLKVSGWGGSGWDKELYITTMLAALGALGVLAVIAVIPVEEKFAEFYRLGLSGGVIDYPG